MSTTLSTVAPLQASIARSIHRLGVLTGREPTALTDLLAPARDLPELPKIVAISDPATLLRRRPQARARSDVALATYEKTVLGALEDTENALVTHARARDSLTHVAAAAETSATASHKAGRRQPRA